MCFDFLYSLCRGHISYSKMNSARYYHKHLCVFKYPLFLSDFKSNSSFCHKFLKNPQTSNFTKICPVETKLFHVGTQTWWCTNMMKLTVAFHNFVNPCNNNPILQLMMMLPSETSHGHFAQTGNRCVLKGSIPGHNLNDSTSHTSFTYT